MPLGRKSSICWSRCSQIFLSIKGRTTHKRKKLAIFLKFVIYLKWWSSRREFSQIGYKNMKVKKIEASFYISGYLLQLHEMLESGDWKNSEYYFQNLLRIKSQIKTLIKISHGWSPLLLHHKCTNKNIVSLSFAGYK
jgi:hypothetical protein